MNIELLAMTQNPIDVMYVAARTCYSPNTPTELYNRAIFDAKEKKLELVKKVLKSGHYSIAEHINFTFAIEEISRACSHQLVRHRLCTFSQQSQRYVEIKENLEVLKEYQSAMRDNNTDALREVADDIIEICNKYFVLPEKVLDYLPYINCLIEYTQKIQDGEKPEDARMYLPNCTKTNIVLTTNLRNLIHMCGLRLCTRAQKEIRKVFEGMKAAVLAAGGELYSDFFDSLLKPQCLQLGFCPENNCCGRAVTKQEMLEAFDKYLLHSDDEVTDSNGEPLAERIADEGVQKALDTIFSEKTLADEAHKQLGDALDVQTNSN